MLPSMRAERPQAVPSGYYYDFIEVGTSNHYTITQFCGNDESSASPLGKEIWTNLKDLRWARGIAMDPVRENLDALPDLPHVEKVVGAMGEWSGQDQFHYVSPENIWKHKGEYRACFSNDPWSYHVDVMWYAGSLGSLGKPHPNLEFMLRAVGRLDLLEEKSVPVYDWGTLCTTFNVRTADVVQLDCEGCDCAILRSMLRHYDDDWNLPRVIAFEANHLTPSEEVDATVKSLCDRGYSVRFRGAMNIMVERDWY